MTPIDFAKKQLRNAEMKQEHHYKLFEQNGDDFDWYVVKKLQEKIKELKKRIETLENTKPIFAKEIQIAYLAKMHEINTDIFCSRHESEKATAIIDEIIESDLNARAKLTLVKLFINNKVTSHEVDEILSE